MDPRKIISSIDHKAEVKRILSVLRAFGMKVINKNGKPRPKKWYGYIVEFDKVKMEAAVVFDNLSPETQVEVCLAVGNKMFWNKVGPNGSFKMDMTKEDFELLLAGAMYDKVPTRQLYNDDHHVAFVVTVGPDGETKVEQVKDT